MGGRGEKPKESWEINMSQVPDIHVRLFLSEDEAGVDEDGRVSERRRGRETG